MALTKVLKLNGYHYNWNTHYADSDELQTGLLVQEVQEKIADLKKEIETLKALVYKQAD